MRTVAGHAERHPVKNIVAVLGQSRRISEHACQQGMRKPSQSVCGAVASGMFANASWDTLAAPDRLLCCCSPVPRLLRGQREQFIPQKRPHERLCTRILRGGGCIGMSATRDNVRPHSSKHPAIASRQSSKTRPWGSSPKCLAHRRWGRQL